MKEEPKGILFTAPDSYIGRICAVGSAVGLTVPTKLLVYLGLEKGDKVKVWIKKVEK